MPVWPFYGRRDCGLCSGTRAPDLPGRVRDICFQKGTGTICEEIMQEEKYRRKAYPGKRE